MFGAFVPGLEVTVAPAGSGVLDGLRFAVKDNIDVAGVVTGAGCPAWRAAAQPAAASAPCVSALLAAGGTLIGKTVSDEMAFSLEGRNAFDGTPVNPACPDGLPGGSSSGSAVAVAANLADLALGTDTGGSVRVPASFCGVYGFRPTFGRVPMRGVVPLAPGYDTVGWFARSAEVLCRAGEALLGAPRSADLPVRRLVIASDAFALCDRNLTDAARSLGASETCDVFGGKAELWRACYRVLQGRDIWSAHGAWITQGRPAFAAGIAARFADAASISDDEVRAMTTVRHTITQRMRTLVPPGTGLILPGAPGPALRRDADGEAIGRFYGRALTLTSVAGHAGLPQIVVPVAGDGCPVGLSIVGWPGSDEALLAFAKLPARS